MSIGSDSWPGARGEARPVFAAKLHKPDLSAYLRRERLYRWLDDADTPLVVVHADAGYGKTVLIASYLQERDRQAIWYHVGTTDRLPGTLVAHLCHALAETFPAAGGPGPDPLQVVHDPEMAGAALAAVLGQLGMPLSLVLEDYNRAEHGWEIHRVVLSMVEHLPPGIQVFLLSRSRPPLPLARLAMAGRVQILTKEDLAFTADETVALFADTYNRHLSNGELALVVRRLEGWAAGLRLTQEALKLTTKLERERFWAHFSESPALFDYLAEEVLVALPAATLHFLYKTSIFSVLQPELIEEFLPGCGAAAMLERLARENLFTTALSGAGTHYRYHNVLRQYLHRQLLETVGEGGVRQLHARAAELYARRDEIGYAIGHSLAAGEYQRVGQLVEQLANHHRGDVLLDLMEGWLERAFPGMEGVCGMALHRLLPMSVYEMVLPGLRQLAEESAQRVDPITQAHAQQWLGVYHYQRGQLDDSLVWLERSASAFRAAGHLIPASYSAALLGLAYLFKGLPEQAEGPVADATAWAGSDSSFAGMNALLAKAELALAFRRFQEAEDAARAFLDRDVPFPVGSSFSYGTLAIALLHQGRTEEAMAAATESLALAQQFGIPAELGFAQMRLATVVRAIGNLKDARETAEKAIVTLKGFDSLLARAMLVRAEAAAATGDPDAQQVWAETCAFWDSHGYQMHRGYDGLSAPLLLGQASQPQAVIPASDRPVSHAALEAGDAPCPGAPAGLEPVNSAPLVIHTLGSFRLLIRGRESEPCRWGRAPSRRLFSYLLLHRGRMVPRDEILEALWPNDDPEQSTNRLWVAVHVLRRQLKPFSHIISRQGQTYCLRLPAGTYLDVDRYLTLVREGLARGNQAALREAARLYRGDFLAEYPYDEFLEAERRRLRELQRQVVMTLADTARRRGQMDAALIWYRQAQRLDPFLEEPVQRIMEVLLARGELGAAADAYRRLRADLRRELDTDPSEELQQLYRQTLTQPGRLQT